MSIHARLVKFNPSILHVQSCLTPVVYEHRVYHTRSSRGVSTRRTFTTLHTQGEHLYLEILVKGSSYNATAILSKIRCIKDKHHMQSKYVTWYGHHHLVLLVSISKASSWSPSSPAQHLVSIVASWSSRQLLLLQLSLTHSDKVKKLHGVFIWYNKETTIRLLSVVILIDMQVMIPITRTWSISYINVYHIMSWPYHITTCHAKTS